MQFKLRVDGSTKLLWIIRKAPVKSIRTNNLKLNRLLSNLILARLENQSGSIINLYPGSSLSN